MKKHAIIPIFISHRGCPNDCVFCNQRRITSRVGNVTVEEANSTILKWLSTLKDVPTKEISFYGGSFTGIPICEQEEFLSLAKEYKDKGDVDLIHLSTRPDYIDEEILNRLKNYSVDVIELGVQSFDKNVLRLSKRGHSVEQVYNACQLIKDYGFTLGIQLMVGLPGDTLETSVYSALETVKIAPSIARIYPTVILKDTELFDLYKSGKYEPLTLDEAVNRSKEIYKILDRANINIIRVGLKSSEIINDEIGFHPAFRQLVEDEIAKETIEDSLINAISQIRNDKLQINVIEGSCLIFTVEITANSKCYGNVFGHKGKNMKYFKSKYPHFKFKVFKDYEKNLKLKDNMYNVNIFF